MAVVGARVKLVMAVLVVCALGLVLGGAKAQPDTSFTSGLCNTQKLQPGDPLLRNVDAALVDLEQNTAYSGYIYRTQYPSASQNDANTAYAYGICNQKLTQSDCTACIKYLHQAIWGICGYAVGARVQLADCYIRYENANFS